MQQVACPMMSASIPFASGDKRPSWPARTSPQGGLGMFCAHAGEDRVLAITKEDDRQTRGLKILSQQVRACHAARDRTARVQAPAPSLAAATGLLDPGVDLEPPFIWAAIMSSSFADILTTTRRSPPQSAQHVPDQVHDARAVSHPKDTWTFDAARLRGSSGGRLVLTFVDGRFIALGHGQ